MERQPIQRNPYMASSIQLGMSTVQPTNSGIMSTSRLEPANRGLQRTNSPIIAPKDDRDRSRSLIGKHYDILDNSYSSEFAGKRNRSEALGSLFNSLTSSTRKANRIQYYKDSGAIEKPQPETVEESAVSKEKPLPAKRESKKLVYVPPKKSIGKTKVDPQAQQKKRESTSIVLKRKVFTNFAPVSQKSFDSQRPRKTADKEARNKQDDEISVLKIIPMQPERKPEEVELVFCSMSGKQPLLKFVSDVKPVPSPVEKPLPASSKLATKRIEARNRIEAFETAPLEKPIKQPGLEKPAEMSSAKSEKNSNQLVKPVAGGRRDEPTFKAPANGKPRTPASPPKRKSAGEALRPAAQDSNEKQATPTDSVINYSREESPKPTEVFRIVLPIKPTQATKVVKVDDRVTVD